MWMFVRQGSGAWALLTLGTAGTAFAITGLPAAPAQADPTEPNELQNPLAVSSGCETCHAYLNASVNAGAPLHAPMGWQGSLMANAARDPVFWAGVALAAQDDPTHTEDCVRCHAPNAFLSGRGDATRIEQLEPADFDGVSCDLCHRSMDDGTTPAGNARYVIDDALQNGSIARRGPFDYGVEAPNHQWIQDTDFLPSGRFCGTCHDVTTPRPRVNAAGEPTGTNFNEQRTYSEWVNSAYGPGGAAARTCQDCHMPAVDDAGGCASFEAQSRHPTGVRRHELVGANRFVTELLADLYGDAGTGEIDDAYFDYSLERMDEFIQTAAQLDVAFPDEVDLTAGLDALGVTVTNLTGHKLPSGYSEGRVMWLEVTARYGDQVVWSSGRWDQAAGAIESDPQVRRYEGIAEDADDGTRNHLLRNNRWVSDTRIPPLGLRPDPETDPVGDRYVLGGDGTWPNYDEVAYAFDPTTVTDVTPGDLDDDRLDLQVRLLYLINTPEYVAQLAADNQSNDAGTRLRGLFDERGGATPVVLAASSVSVPLRGLDAGDGGDGGDDGGTGESDAGTGGNASGDGGNGGQGCACGIYRPVGPGGAAWLVGVIALLGWRGRERRGRVSSVTTSPTRRLTLCHGPDGTGTRL